MTLHPNQNIDIIIETESGQEIYRSRIEDINEKQLLIAAPLKHGVVVPIRLNTKLIISYLKVDLKEQGRYQAEGLVVERFSVRNLPMLLLDITSSWQKIQLRNYVRVDVLLDAKYNGSNPCIIKDISGGGLLFYCNERLEVKEKITIDFEMNSSILRCRGEIVRIEPSDHGFEYGLSFIDIDEKTREKIIRFVYKRQIELYRKAKSQKS